MRLAKPERRLDHPFRRVWNVLRVGIAQTKILREPVAGLMHATIFWGFMVLTAGTIELLIAGVFPTFSYARLLPLPLYHGYELSQDAFATLVLGAIAFAYFRRLVLRPRRLAGDNVEHLDAYIILGMIAALMLTYLLAGGFLAVARPGAVQMPRFASLAVAAAVSAMDAEAAWIGYKVSWWLHALLVLAF